MLSSSGATAGTSQRSAAYRRCAVDDTAPDGRRLGVTETDDDDVTRQTAREGGHGRGCAGGDGRDRAME